MINSTLLFYRKKVLTSTMGRREKLLGLVFPLLKIILFSIPLSFFDFATDIWWTFKYLTSPVTFVRVIGVLLLLVVITNNCVSSYYGLTILRCQPQVYPRLWGSHIRRFTTCLLQLLGLGSVVFQLDYLTDFISFNKFALTRFIQFS